VDIDAFWQLIEEARSAQEVPADAETVAQALAQLSCPSGEGPDGANWHSISRREDSNSQRA